jgi:hypothetical protein
MSRTAVVLGGSIAGLLAARALAGPYQQVVVVERDELPDSIDAEPRRGVPQGRHVHGLLAGGVRAIESLVPGFGDGLVAHGAHRRDPGLHNRFLTPRGRLKQVVSGESTFGASRPLIESYLRAQVRQIPQVEFVDRTDIIAPTFRGSGPTARVTGVRVQTAGEPERHLEADLVVDATGRGSRTPRWLSELNLPTPAEESVRVDLTYTTRAFRLTFAETNDDVAIITVPTPEVPRGGALVVAENGLGLLTLYGMFGEHAPTDVEGFLDFAGSLARPDTYDTVKGLEPVGEAATFRFPGSVRRRYERLRHFPAGLLVLGDAVCSFNPAYGQGMSVCAIQATVLRRLAAADPAVSPQRFFRAISSIVDTPWQIVTGGDLSHPRVEGHRPAALKVINRYLQRLQRAAVRDVALSLAFHRVTNLVAAPPTLMRPDRAVRVLLRG